MTFVLHVHVGMCRHSVLVRVHVLLLAEEFHCNVVKHMTLSFHIIHVILCAVGLLG